MLSQSNIPAWQKSNQWVVGAFLEVSTNSDIHQDISATNQLGQRRLELKLKLQWEFPSYSLQHSDWKY